LKQHESTKPIEYVLSSMNLRTTLLVCLLSPVVWAAESANRPNIIFVLFDDLGYGEPASFRQKSEFKMPNLDRLTREGIRFTDAHSAASVCTPTRYGALTGRYPWRIGQFGVLQTFSPPIIEREQLTVGSLLRQHGYHTACIGKWHLGMNWVGHSNKKSSDSLPAGSVATDGPITRGFDYFCGYTHSRNIGMIIEQDKVVTNLPPVEVQPLLTKRAVNYLEERAKAGGPFFLYVPLSPPHLPIVPAPEFVGKSGAEDYSDWIYQGDDVLGQILEVLARHKMADNTLVIVSSDNGAAHRSYPPLRGSKGSIWEGGHREPFVARWPGRIRPGSVCDDTICLNDLLATCADIVGVKLPDNAGEDSVSILPSLLRNAKGPVRESTVHQSPGGELAIRQGPWKLVFGRGGKRELYNLKDDLGEKSDVADEHDAIVERLANLMQRYIDTGRSTPGAPQKNTRNQSLSRRIGPKPAGAESE